MLTELERIDDRRAIEDMLSPRSFVANGATPLWSPATPATGRSAWQSPGFYVGAVLMVLILAATWLVRLAIALRGTRPSRFSA